MGDVKTARLYRSKLKPCSSRVFGSVMAVTILASFMGMVFEMFGNPVCDIFGTIGAVGVLALICLWGLCSPYDYADFKIEGCTIHYIVYGNRNDILYDNLEFELEGVEGFELNGRDLMLCIGSNKFKVYDYTGEVLKMVQVYMIMQCANKLQ